MRVLCLSVVILVFAGITNSRAQDFITFDIPGSVPGNTLANGINNREMISGYYADTYGWHGFLLTKKQELTTFDVPGAAGTYAFGLNDKSEVVGRCVMQMSCLT